MEVMKEAVDKEDWLRDEFKAKPKKKKEKVMPETKPLTGVKQIKLEDLPLDDLLGFTEIPRSHRNADGVVFIGFNVTIRVRDAKKAISGWMSEGDVIKLRQLTRIPVR